MGRNQVYVANTSEQGEFLSWLETVNEEKKLLLEIRGRVNPSEREIVDKICVFSVINSRQFYLNGVERQRDNSCLDNSMVNLQKEGNWKFEHTFGNPKRRIIRIQKIYKEKITPGSNSYIDLTVGKSIGEN